ncbi:hypothetical protein, partial [Vibrio cholerae]
IQQNCKHVGRYSVLVRITRQAAVKGSKSAEQALNTLTARFNDATNKSTSHDFELPTWAECIRSNWPMLMKLGVCSGTVNLVT